MAASSKKDTLIEEAQKFASRGQFDKAAKAYEQIIVLEPGAINHRQKFAELLIKCARNDDARKEFETVANHFSKNGFYLKAIAVYKQLQKLFPADISLSLTLAELNEKHGLVANAISEYTLVYEYYEKSHNVPEALNILDRMQNVDPKNISIKIKLAEAYVQQGKKTEAYAVFTKTAALLIERSDNITLSKVCSRVQQLFSEKPDFLFEVLSELIRQGSATTAIGSLQNLLRSNPNNKSVWELTIQAYQLLNQPQKVKIAYQHYLKYFSAEPVAMLGLISSITAEQNLTSALELLDQYESTLISAGFLQQLEQIYHALDKLDPINTKVLEGLFRVVTAAGNEGEIVSLTSKLKSLHTVSLGKQSISAEQGSSTALPSDEPPEAGFSEDMMTTPSLFDEEVEIEIDIDSPFSVLEEESGKSSSNENWLDSVGALFDTVNSAPRGVKFSNEQENSDAQSHFDLGQAFKEMGLYDEALNEFHQASQDPSLLVGCLIMQCVCLRERGELEKATTILLALLKPGLTPEESCAVKYELATGYETAGKTEEAHALFNEINSTNPGFRDINSRLNATSISDLLDFSDDDLNDFGLK
jgi:tetratricopeptide (TPR) repeat protein